MCHSSLIPTYSHPMIDPPPQASFIFSHKSSHKIMTTHTILLESNNKQSGNNNSGVNRYLK